MSLEFLWTPSTEFNQGLWTFGAVNIKFLHNPVGYNLIYVFLYDFRCFYIHLHGIAIFVTFTYEKKVVITKFVSGIYESQKSLTNECRRQSK
jgi:hypothetical protein